MKEIQISKFKATCLAVIEEVRRTGEPVRVTRRGEVMVRLEPERDPDRNSWIASWQGKGAILGDIVSPASEESDWKALKR